MPWSVRGCTVFFFRAEDGIRDADVTGVQTCALPISPGRSCATTSRSATPRCRWRWHCATRSATSRSPAWRSSRSTSRRCASTCRCGASATPATWPGRWTASAWPPLACWTRPRSTPTCATRGSARCCRPWRRWTRTSPPSRPPAPAWACSTTSRESSTRRRSGPACTTSTRRGCRRWARCVPCRRPPWRRSGRPGCGSTPTVASRPAPTPRSWPRCATWLRPPGRCGRRWADPRPSGAAVAPGVLAGRDRSASVAGLLQRDRRVDELVGDDVLWRQARLHRLLLRGVDRADDVDGPLDAAHVEVAQGLIAAVADDAELELLLRGELGEVLVHRVLGLIVLVELDDQLVHRVGVLDVVDLRLLEHRHQPLQAVRELALVGRTDRQRRGVDRVAGVVDELEGDRLLPLRELVLVDERLAGGEALLGDLPARGDVAVRRPGVAAVHLVLAQDARADQVVHVGGALEVEHLGVGLADVGDGVEVRVDLGVPHDHLRVDVQGCHHGRRGLLGGELHGRVGEHEGQRDRLVEVHLRAGLLEADRRPAGPHLDLDAGVLALGHQRPGDPLLVRIHLVAGSKELVGAAVLWLRPPIGLDHHGVGADPLEALRAAGGRRVRAAAGLRAVAAARGGGERQTERAGQQRERAVPAHGPPSSSGATETACSVRRLVVVRSVPLGSRPDSCQRPTTRRARKLKHQNTTTPSIEEANTAAKSCSDWSRARYRSIRMPMPGSPCLKKKSPTIAPITDAPAAMRRPVKIAGSAAGSSSFHSRVSRPAECRVNRSCWLASTDWSPNKVLAMIGNSAMSTQTSTRLGKPKPNQNPSSGTSARIGMVWSTTAYGYSERSIQRAWCIRIAMPMPHTTASASPSSATLVDSSSAAPISRKLSRTRKPTCTTWCGR